MTPTVAVVLAIAVALAVGLVVIVLALCRNAAHLDRQNDLLLLEAWRREP